MISNQKEWQKLLLSFSQRALNNGEFALLVKLIADRIPIDLPDDETYRRLSDLTDQVRWVLNDYIDVSHSAFYKEAVKEATNWIEARRNIANPRKITYREVPCDTKFMTEWLLKLQLTINPVTTANIAELGKSRILQLGSAFNHMLDDIEAGLREVSRSV